MTKHDAELKHLHDENDALRAEIVKLRQQLEDCQMIREEQASYTRAVGGQPKSPCRTAIVQSAGREERWP